jgi:Cortical protein marker for cell polarity
MPDIKQSGNYSVMIFTPGCIQDGSCQQRGKVNITGNMASAVRSMSPLQTELYQTNNFDKYDPIYYGYVDASSGSFRPSITLAPSADQSGSLTVVAHKVRFELVNSTGGLNGLFDFNPNLAVINVDLSNSTIDQAGSSLDTGAVVHDVAIVDNTTFIAGNFSSSSVSNILSIQNDKQAPLPGGGLNGEVRALLLNGTLLYVGGKFSGTKEGGTTGLSNVAAYSIPDQKWLPLGSGVNGRVRDFVLFTLNITANKPEPVISLTGDFDQVLAFAGNDASQANGLAIWVPSRSNWLQNLNVQTPSVAGLLTAGVKLPSGNYLLAGSLASGGLRASGAVTLSTSGTLGLNQLPLKIQPKSSQGSSKRKRAQATPQNVTGIVTGYFYESGNRNLTILGGHFTALGSNGSSIDNLVFINGSNNDAVTGMGNGLSSDSAFLALAVQSDMLYAGGLVTGTINGTNVSGLVVYDLIGAKFGTQPAAFSGPDVSVNAIAPRPNTGDIYVAGNFETAGSLDCPSICFFSSSDLQWNRPGSGISGSISAITWAGSNKLVVSGNLTVNDSISSVAAYDAKSNKWTPFQGASGIPGPVTALAAGDGPGTQFWVAGVSNNGSAFIMKYDGSTWQSLGDSFGKNTTIRGLQVLSLSKDHAKSASLDPSQTLLITGELNLPNFGNVSAVLFNGTTFFPFILSNNNNGPGSLSHLFSQKQNFFSPNRELLN